MASQIAHLPPADFELTSTPQLSSLEVKPYHNVCIRIHILRIRIHRGATPEPDTHDLVCARDAHGRPHGRELRLHTLALELAHTRIAPRRLAPAEPLRRCAPTLRRGGGDPAPGVHPARTRAPHARDVPLQIRLLVPPILDLRRIYPALAIARATYRGGRRYARLDAGEDGGGARGDHRDAPRGGGQVGTALRVRACDLHAAGSRRCARCLGHPEALDPIPIPHPAHQPSAISNPKIIHPSPELISPSTNKQYLHLYPFDSQTHATTTIAIQFGST